LGFIRVRNDNTQPQNTPLGLGSQREHYSTRIPDHLGNFGLKCCILKEDTKNKITKVLLAFRGKCRPPGRFVASTYKSLLGTIFMNRRLRIENEPNSLMGRMSGAFASVRSGLMGRASRPSTHRSSGPMARREASGHRRASPGAGSIGDPVHAVVRWSLVLDYKQFSNICLIFELLGPFCRPQCQTCPNGSQ
jgi:hypothetical protein